VNRDIVGLKHLYESNAFYDNHILYKILKVDRHANRANIQFALRRQHHFKATLLKDHARQIDLLEQRRDELIHENLRSIKHLTELYDKAKLILLDQSARDRYDAIGDSGDFGRAPRPVGQVPPNRYVVQHADAVRLQDIPHQGMPETILADARR